MSSAVAKVPLAMPRRHPLLKAIGGVVVLVTVAAIAGTFGVRAIQQMINENGKTRLQRFTDGTDSPTVATVGDPAARITVELPSEPQAGHETLTYLGGVRQVARVISPAGDDAVQILWFNVLPSMALNPEATLKSLASAQAGNLGGANPLDEGVVSTGTVAKLDFRVQPSAGAADGPQYYVRIMMRGNLVYVVRVEAKTGGRDALMKVVGSIAWARPART